MADSGMGSSRRVADKAIYSGVSEYGPPKEYFRLIGRELAAELGEPDSIVDVGCSNGALLNHLGECFPKARLTGVDPVPELLEVGRRLNPRADFILGSLLEEGLVSRVERAQAVTMAGVIGIFFDPAEVMERLAALVAPGGCLMLFSPFNEEPVDVHLQYRYAPSGEWEIGHNLYSCVTMNELAQRLGLRPRWVDFRMPFPIAKGDDPMRSWTESFRDDPNHLFYGTGMHCTMKLLVLRQNR